MNELDECGIKALQAELARLREERAEAVGRCAMAVDELAAANALLKRARPHCPDAVTDAIAAHLTGAAPAPKPLRGIPHVGAVSDYAATRTESHFDHPEYEYMQVSEDMQERDALRTEAEQAVLDAMAAIPTRTLPTWKASPEIRAACRAELARRGVK